MSSVAQIAPKLSRPPPPSYRSLSAYPVKLLSPPYDRRFFLELKLGWLLAPCLDGPFLVYPERHIFEAMALEELLPEVRRAVANGYRGIARAKAERRAPEEARLALARAIKQLRAIHRRLVMRAAGYAYPGLHFAATGQEFVCMFGTEEEVLGAMLGNGGPAVQTLYTAPPGWDLEFPEAPPSPATA